MVLGESRKSWSDGCDNCVVRDQSRTTQRQWVPKSTKIRKMALITCAYTVNRIFSGACTLNHTMKFMVLDWRQ